MKNSLKKLIKKIPFMFNFYHLLKDKWNQSKCSQKIIMLRVLRYNKTRFLQYSGAFKNSKGKDMAYLTWLYHVIEKGLAMPNMRLGFGQEKVKELGKQLEHYVNAYGKQDVTCQAAVETLHQYKMVHEQAGYVLPADIVRVLNSFAEKRECDQEREYTRDLFFKNKNAAFPIFAQSRHSVRNFDTSKKIPIDELIDAIWLAQTAPSACNRQATHVHIITDSSMIQQCLSMQNGNRGFGDLVDKLLILTGNLQTILGAQEFFDLNTNIGIFIMNLSYALSYHEIGHCILNWYVMPNFDRRLRKITNIPEEENIVAFIVCGYIPEEFKVAISPRLKVEDIVTIH